MTLLASRLQDWSDIVGKRHRLIAQILSPGDAKERNAKKNQNSAHEKTCSDSALQHKRKSGSCHRSLSARGLVSAGKDAILPRKPMTKLEAHKRI
jgi:hypothetical protein